jgi:hypothetical protein
MRNKHDDPSIVRMRLQSNRFAPATSESDQAGIGNHGIRKAA